MHYGLAWVTVPTATRLLLFINTHLSPYEGFEDDRTAQASDLIRFWNGRPRAVIVGDFNAVPEENAIRRILSTGLVDADALSGAPLVMLPYLLGVSLRYYAEPCLDTAFPFGETHYETRYHFAIMLCWQGRRRHCARTEHSGVCRLA